MAKKKKNASQKIKKQQQKQQRRSARVQKRRPVASVHASGQAMSTVSQPASDVILDLREIINWQGRREISESAIAQLIEMSMESDYLIEEPEFDEITIEPETAIETYIQTAESLGLTPDDLDIYGNTDSNEDSNEDEEDGPVATFYKQMFRKLLTAELQSSIIAALSQVRQRLRQEGDQEALLDASAAQFFLETDKEGEISVAIGLVRAILMRSVQAGFVMFASLAEMYLGEEDENVPLSKLRKRITKAASKGDVAKMVEESPGLLRMLNAQMEKRNEAGYKALFTSKLHLGIFTDQELDQALAIIEAHSSRKLRDVTPPEFFKCVNWSACTPKVTDYLEALFTRPRIKQLEKRFKQILDDPAYRDHELADFILNMSDLVIDDADVELIQRLLSTALLGEIFQRRMEP